MRPSENSGKRGPYSPKQSAAKGGGRDKLRVKPHMKNPPCRQAMGGCSPTSPSRAAGQGGQVIKRSGQPGRSRDFGREIGLGLLDAFAELEADIVLQHDLGACGL